MTPEQQDLFPLHESVSEVAFAGDNLQPLLALAEVQGLGPSSVAALYDAFPDLEDAWRAPGDELLRILTGARNPAPAQTVEAMKNGRDEAFRKAGELEAVLQQRRISLVERGQKWYPPSLNELNSPPRWLFVEGDPSLLNRLSTAAVVGTRKATDRGTHAAELVASFLVEMGWTVLSGLAEGIDAAAHRATLDLGGEAIAVLGTGILLDFPAATVHLRRAIAETGGAVVSEYLPNTRYSRQTFVQRNRIQAALSSIVIPVEGAEKSGTAHTVRFARELERRLVGVFHSSTAPGESNEILEVLRRAGAPIFDLGSSVDRQEMSELLTDVAGDPRSSTERAERVRRRAYGPALRMLWKSLQARPPDQKSQEWLVRTVEDLIHRVLEEDES